MEGLEHYDRADLWGDDYGSSDDEQRANAIRASLPSGVRTVLDVGCGDGTITNVLADDVDITGVDISEQALQYVRAPTTVAGADDLPFDDRSFDAVLLAEVIEHLEPKTFDRALSEAARVARSTILITVPNRESLKGSARRCPRCGEHFSPWRHQRSFRPSDLRGLVRGFNTEVVEEIGPLTQFPTALDGTLVRLKYRDRLLFPAVCPACGLEGERPSGTPLEALPDSSAPRWLRFFRRTVLRPLRPPPRHRWLLARYGRPRGKS